MLHNLDLVPVREVRSRTGKAYKAGQSGKRLSQARANCRAAASPPASSIRDTVADVVERMLLERRAPAAAASGGIRTSAASEAGWLPMTPAAPCVDFVCEKDVLAAVQRDGKILIGPSTIVTPGATDLAARCDVLVLALR